MNLATITMDPTDAAERAAAYADLEQPNEEQAAIYAGYLAMVAGKQLINLADTIRAGGHDENGWPRLAAMAADQRWCYLMADQDSRGTARWRFAASQRVDGRTAARNSYSFTCADVGDVKRCGGWASWEHRRAMVPPVPPDLHPRRFGRRLALRHFVTLWEVPEWEQAPRPPGDPALLRHLAGDLFTVEAVWDLTELEQAVLAGRNKTA